MNRKSFSCEFALCLVMVFNPLSICLMTKSGFGISTISSVPFVLQMIFPAMTLGTWNFLFQTLLVVALMILRRSFCPEYLFSFVIGSIFGKMVDVHTAWVSLLPESPMLRVVYFLTGFLIMCVGICLANNCKLPVTPTDIFPRDLGTFANLPYNKIKTTFDLICLSTTLILSIFVLRGFFGIGFGTIFCAFVTGKVISLVQKFLDRHVVFVRVIELPAKRKVRTPIRPVVPQRRLAH